MSSHRAQHARNGCSQACLSMHETEHSLVEAATVVLDPPVHARVLMLDDGASPEVVQPELRQALCIRACSTPASLSGRSTGAIAHRLLPTRQGSGFWI